MKRRRGEINMSTSRIMKIITGALEATLAIPFLGGIIVLGFGYYPLFIMLVLHITTLVLTKKDNGAAAGSIIGIVTSLVGWIPFLGWIMHILSAIFLMIGAITKDKEQIGAIQIDAITKDEEQID